MPNKRLSMRDIRESLRLYSLGLSYRKIGECLHIAPNSVREYVSRAKCANILSVAAGMTERELEIKLFPSTTETENFDQLQPNWAEIHTEMKRRSVTLKLLWQEYNGSNPAGLQYSQFCECYSRFRGSLRLSMRQVHVAGEKLFVDYSGQKLPITDAATGEIRDAEIFVAVLGASNYTFAEATWTQGLGDWTKSHVHAFEYFGGVSSILVPDNLKSGVDKPDLYDPVINRTYDELARHYGTIVIPARVRKPKDKAKAEAGVLLVERWILASLRNTKIFSLSEANEIIKKMLVKLNTKKFQKLDGSRKELFESIERCKLKPLPDKPYEFAQWKQTRVNIDYHIEVSGCYYSVPYKFRNKKIDVRYTETSVECFIKGERIAVHSRLHKKGTFETCMEHMPNAHQAVAGWTPEKFLDWGKGIGPNALTCAEQLFVDQEVPYKAFRTLFGIFNLSKEYSCARLDAACGLALKIHAVKRASIMSILKTGRDQQLLEPPHEQPLIVHENVRGPEYYTAQEGN